MSTSFFKSLVAFDVDDVAVVVVVDVIICRMARGGQRWAVVGARRDKIQTPAPLMVVSAKNKSQCKLLSRTAPVVVPLLLLEHPGVND